jgi:hypothetical protein
MSPDGSALSTSNPEQQEQEMPYSVVLLLRGYLSLSEHELQLAAERGWAMSFDGKRDPMYFVSVPGKHGFVKAGKTRYQTVIDIAAIFGRQGRNCRAAASSGAAVSMERSSGVACAGFLESWHSENRCVRSASSVEHSSSQRSVLRSVPPKRGGLYAQRWDGPGRFATPSGEKTFLRCRGSILS